MASFSSIPGAVHVGMDTSKNTIVVGILGPADRDPVVERIFNDEASVRRLVGRLGRPDRLRCCYEAGPGGFELHRLLTSLGVVTDVVAPSLIPRGYGDRVKTDRRDAIRLARLLRAGELTPVRVPTPAEEAVRELVRVRRALVDDRKRIQQRIGALMLRHGRIFRDGVTWTQRHRAWLAAQAFSEPALAAALAVYLGGLEAREAELAALETQLHPLARDGSLAPLVGRLGAYRGIAELSALTLAAEVVDFRRFASARAFMGFTGLTATEYSSGERVRRGHITKAGSVACRTTLIESAWSYCRGGRPRIGVGLKARQAGAAPATLARSWAAQQRLSGKYHRMMAAGRPRGVAVVAVARELAGFVWAEMTSPAG